jgi:hypothetical protein
MRVYESRVSYGVVCLKIYVSSTDQAELRYPTTHSQLLFNRNLRRTESSHTNKYCKSRVHSSFSYLGDVGVTIDDVVLAHATSMRLPYSD